MHYLKRIFSFIFIIYSEGGIGGPARAIARFSGCTIVGLNNNEYQIERARKQTKAAFLEDQVSFVRGDFMKRMFFFLFFRFDHVKLNLRCSTI